MHIVHFYYPEMIRYNYLFKPREKTLNTLLASDNIPRPNQFGAGFSREESGWQAGQHSGNHVGRRDTYYAPKTTRLKRNELASAGAMKSKDRNPFEPCKKLYCVIFGHSVIN